MSRRRAKRGIAPRPRSGTGRRTVSSLGFLALLLLSAIPAIAISSAAGSDRAGAPDSPPDGSLPELESLLASFGSMPGLSARFREEKHLLLLREPLVSHGALYFAPPDRMLRRVEKPIESFLVLRDRELAFGSPLGTRTLDLDAHPMVAAFVDALRLVLAGDLDSLRQLYRIGFDALDKSANPRWEIHLEPLHGPAKRAIASIRIGGEKHTLTELRVLEANGDETVTYFSSVDTKRRFTEGELATLFWIPES